VNVTIEHLSPCKKLVRVEIDAEATRARADAVLKEFQRKVRLPGFRPGKTPRALLLKTFAQEINAEMKRRITSDAYREAIEQHKLRPITRPEIEETPWEL